MDDLERLQGVWRRVSYEDATGKASPEVVRRMATIVFAGSNFAVKTGDYIWTAGFVVVDAGQTPKAIDFIPAWEGQVLDAPQLAIYELDGDDLTINLGRTRGERPRQFLSGSGQSVER